MFNTKGLAAPQRSFEDQILSFTITFLAFSWPLTLESDEPGAWGPSSHRGRQVQCISL